MKQNKFPPGWDEERVQKVIDYYENQTEDEAVAEAEEAFRNESMKDQSDSKNELNRVLEKIQEIVKKSAGGNYIYRGEPEQYKEHPYHGKVSSNLYRSLLTDAIMEEGIEEYRKVIESNIGNKEKGILESAKEYLYEVDSETISDFEILARLQHYGCKTNLIDFTTDYLIALFFACDRFYHKDGRVILQKRKSEDYQTETPSEAIKRVESQKSVLLRSPKGFINPDVVVVIPKELKLSVLNYLEKYHDISTKKIYKDIHGFIKWIDGYLDPMFELGKGLINQNRGNLANEVQEKQYWYEKALAHYTETLKLVPDCVEAYNNRGAIYRDKGEFDLAHQDFNIAIDLEPDCGNAYNNRGMAYGKNGKHDSALQDFDSAIDLDPESADSYNNRGLTYKEIGEVDLALEDYNKAIELDPGFPEAYNNRGVVYDERGERDNAIKDYSKAIELKPYYANAYKNRGMAYSDRGDVNRAISDFSIVVQLKSDDASVYNSLGVEYSKKNQLDNALQNYSKAIEHNPNYAKAYSNRGAAYLDKGEHDKGIQNLNKAIELNPDYAEAYSNRGAVYFNISEYDNAIQDLNKAIELNPDYAEAYSNRGAAYLNKGEHDKGIQNLNKAIELNPDYANAYKNRGAAYSIIGETNRAIEDYNAAIKLEPNDAETYRMRGVAYRMKGEPGNAIENYSFAIKLKADYAEAYGARSEAWLHLKEWEKAKADLIQVKNLGIDIAAAFHNDYESIADFEQKNDIQLPKDIVTMLKQQ